MEVTDAEKAALRSVAEKRLRVHAEADQIIECRTILALLDENDALRASKTVVQCGFSAECRANYDRAEKAEAERDTLQAKIDAVKAVTYSELKAMLREHYYASGHPSEDVSDGKKMELALAYILAVIEGTK
jgi:hypothetical protein